MNSPIRKTIEWTIAITLMAALAACMSTGQKQSAAKKDALQSGFLHGYYDKMEPSPYVKGALRWINPDADFGKYNKIMLDSVVFYFAEDSESKDIDAHQMVDVADECNVKMVKVFNEGGYTVVTEPGPDVIRCRFAITDIKKSKPGLSAVTSVVPIGLAVNVAKKGVTGKWTGAGATSGEVMWLDSSTDTVLAVGMHSKSAEFTERFSKWGSTSEAFEFWAKKCKEYLDRAHVNK